MQQAGGDGCGSRGYTLLEFLIYLFLICFPPHPPTVAAAAPWLLVPCPIGNFTTQ